MFPQNQNSGGGFPPPGGGGGPPGLGLMTIIIAILCAIVATPPLDKLTADIVTNLAAETYGLELAQLIRWVWAVCLAGLIFSTARISAGIGSMMLVSSVWLKFLPI